ncbi:unnamed protein product [Symbiodinium natans]|uniref:Transmembrane protein n=1 Tax=Symbiodinium natans TaxID=878477 RepID=A0A812TY76_9DINO|nr:unnamed protein product [Symbiodinium natans]
MGSSSSCCCDKKQDDNLPMEMVRAQPMEALKCEGELPPKEDVVIDTSVANYIRKSYLEAMKILQVDNSIARGISVGSSLGAGGRLWQTSPVDMDEDSRSRLWDKSKPVERFDVFFSHSWRTPGKWKVLSLLFQYGWPFVMVCWACVAGLVFVLGAFGLLSTPLIFNADVLDFKKACPFAPWVYLSGIFTVLISLLLSPYWLYLRRSPNCFLDVVSINQSDPDLMERGIYGLGGFLSISNELRVLWSPPYLSRLWCVFELAAYRKANPSGPVCVKPLFVERQACLLMLGSYAGAGIFCVVFAVRLGLRFSLPVTMLTVTPLLFIVHGNRMFMREKHELIASLQNFEVEAAECRLQSDREFVLSAIAAWYGSEEAFTEYVRGPLRQELLGMSMTNLPLSYALIIAAGPFGIALDVVLAFIRGGAPLDAILSEFIGSCLGWALFWVLLCIKVMWWLCDRYAAARSSKTADYLTSLGIFMVFFVFFFAGAVISDILYTTSLWGGVGFSVVTLFLVVLAYGKLPCRVRP